MADGKSRGTDRTRNWSLVVYPDSAPENWRSILDELHIQWIESPLHDCDSNPTGEVKKAHWHIALMFAGPKTFEQICEIIKPLNCPIPERCHNVKAMTRYMAHLDNPEKYQYSVSKIRGHGGVDIAELLRPSASERYTVIAEMTEFIKSEHITEFQDLVDYARSEKFDTWFPLLCDNSAYFVGQYIKSQRHRSETPVK